MTFQRDGRTLAGEPPDEVANVAATLGADVTGVNCSLGPQSALEVDRVDGRAQTSMRLSAMPNAGLPRFIDRRLVYPSTPEYFAEYTRKLVEAGAQLVGGCCGTTPEHTSAMRDGARPGVEPPRPSVGRSVARRAVAARRSSRCSRQRARRDEPPRRTLREKLAAGEFVVSVELDPPRGLNPRKALEGAAHLKALGVDCINIGDSPMARVRMSAVALARADRAAASASSRSSTSRRATGT